MLTALLTALAFAGGCTSALLIRSSIEPRDGQQAAHRRGETPR